jgi:hypothetical protein
MSDGKFEKVTRSEKTLYGPRKIILCGFTAGMQAKFEKVLDFAGLQGLAAIWAGEKRIDDTIGQLMELPAGTGAAADSTLPRTIVVAGISENELHNLMNTCRASGMKAALWAVLTPVSAKWTLRQLITELEAERAALENSN